MRIVISELREGVSSRTVIRERGAYITYILYIYKYLGHLGIYVLEIILYCIAGPDKLKGVGEDEEVHNLNGKIEIHEYFIGLGPTVVSVVWRFNCSRADV